MAQPFQDFCEDRARAGEGAYAIAYAILDLAQAQGASASAMRNLGLADAATPFGAIEAFMMQFKETGERIAGAIENKEWESPC